ncbi:MAG: hypothetical protein ACD_79C01346G0001 [uncultured bacterium]|nr:MAG: hypothetical protein ACD_79C01346G0001 [uncultured bacterium]
MIKTLDDIRDIFNILHDGDIIDYEEKEKDLKLRVKISYLTERVREGYSYFTVTLFNYIKIQLETWPNQKGHEPEFYRDLNQIFQANLWILDAEIKEKSIVVSCSQADTAFDYCGGYLAFTSESAKVEDEAGKEYTIEELGNLSEAYWEEWENNNKNKI